MRYLLIPQNNSLSHVAKCLAIREVLLSKGHEVLIAVNRRHSQLLSRIGGDCHILQDIQEIDGAPFPTTLWFKHPQRFTACIKEEVALLKNYNPDKVLGVFRFTTKASAQIAGISYDSLICGCMLPDSPEVLGYADGETGIDLQKENLKGFFQYAGAKTSTALVALGLGKINDIRYMLKGDRTFLWDFPEFFPIKLDANTTHVGPIVASQWPDNPIDSLWRNVSEDLTASIREALSYAFSKNLPVLSFHALEEFGLRQRYRSYLLLSPNQLFQRSHKDNWCRSPWQTIAVDVSGNAAVCDCQPENRVGNILKQPFSKIWNGKMMIDYRRRMLGANPPEACMICPRF